LFGGLRSALNVLGGLDHFAHFLIAGSIFFLLFAPLVFFLYWLVGKAITHKFSAEFRVPSILYFRIGYPNPKRTRTSQRRRELPNPERKSAEFGKLLRTLRIKRRVTLHQLALVLNLTSPELSSLEKGTTEPTSELVEKIAVFLKLSEQECSILKDAGRLSNASE